MAHPYAMGRTRAKAGAGAVPGPKTRFSWTDDERETIARKSLFAMAQDNKLSRVDALRLGVDSLPRERRKPIIDWAHSQWVVPYWERIAAEHDAQQTAKQKAHDLFTDPKPQVQETPKPAAVEPAVAPIETVTTPPQETGEMAATKGSKNPAASERAKRGITKGRTLIRWTSGERHTIAKAFVKARQDFSDMSKTEALRKAVNDTMPDNRQRKIAGYSLEADWIDPLIATVTHEIELEKQARESQRAEQQAQEEAQKREQTQREEQKRQDAELHEMELDEARQVAIAEYQATAPLEDLISAVARRLVGALVAPLLEGISDAVREARHTTNPAVPRFDMVHVNPPPRAHKPKIYVVGLIREQHQNLSKAFPNTDINFGANLDQGGISAEKANHADLVLLMTEYTSHVIRAQLKRSAPNLVSLTGSLSTAKRCIAQWLSAEGAKMAA